MRGRGVAIRCSVSHAEARARTALVVSVQRRGRQVSGATDNEAARPDSERRD